VSQVWLIRVESHFEGLPLGMSLLPSAKATTSSSYFCVCGIVFVDGRMLQRPSSRGSGELAGPRCLWRP
jgi:hypothetical protein